MDSQQLLSQILNQIHSSSDIRRVSKQLNLLESSLYSTDDSKWVTVLHNELEPQLSMVIQEYYGMENKPLTEEIRQLQSAIRSVKKVNITLAFYPKQIFIRELAGVMREIIGQNIIIQLHVEPKIVGGIQIEYEGKFKDLSVGAKIVQLFEQQRKALGY